MATSICCTALRVLSRLEEAEKREPNPHAQADYRIAWITTLYAARGDPLPFVMATYRVLGIHPAKVWPRIVKRRKLFTGVHYEEFFGGLPPKKPVQNVRLSEIEQVDDAA